MMASLFRRKRSNESKRNKSSSEATQETPKKNRAKDKVVKEGISTKTFKVKIPPNVNPGDEFQVYGEKELNT